MATETRLTTVETVHDEGSWLFTARDLHGEPEEIILVPCDDGVEAWVNRCTHEAQRLDRGFGAAMRDGELICPKHGSLFDACSGDCDNGEAAGTRLVSIEVAVVNDAEATDGDGREQGGAADERTGDESTSTGVEFVSLIDRQYTFGHIGGLEDGDDTQDDDDSGPSSTSHISL
ncbi:Rieske (2Fe-2S) protein [Halostagnicola sp. A-GB9-2]|uniref:Rieske (2Fe-2S) protein n=1 Tax=Halostagnicola sp. A-GB9-2 TaxID=3048066 RepID=UPI0024BF7472|nr:Rieske (2Fe-2S) protein [Halostagnicola sp. A-GB9-2]MDJ1430454.1 Rieske (2Fe-2S) protein [Halostagnicola sp. A-GB9-2]